MENKIFKTGKIVDIRSIIIEQDMNSFGRMNHINILKFKVSNYKKIAKVIAMLSNEDNIMKVLFEKETLISLNSLDKVGRPDYFIWNNNEYYFAEYKSRYDYLRQKQYDWFKKYYQILPLIIIQSSNKK